MGVENNTFAGWSLDRIRHVRRRFVLRVRQRQAEAPYDYHQPHVHGSVQPFHGTILAGGIAGKNLRRCPRDSFLLAQIYEAKGDRANEAVQLREYLKYATDPGDVAMVKEYLAQLER